MDQASVYVFYVFCFLSALFSLLSFFNIHFLQTAHTASVITSEQILFFGI